MENLNEVSKQRLPDTESKFMEEVDNHHSGDIKLPSVQLDAFVERILYCKVQSDPVGRLLTVPSLTIVGTEDVSLSRLSTQAPATARPTW